MHYNFCTFVKSRDKKKEREREGRQRGEEDEFREIWSIERYMEQQEERREGVSEGGGGRRG